MHIFNRACQFTDVTLLWMSSIVVVDNMYTCACTCAPPPTHTGWFFLFSLVHLWKFWDRTSSCHIDSSPFIDVYFRISLSHTTEVTGINKNLHENVDRKERLIYSKCIHQYAVPFITICQKLEHPSSILQIRDPSNRTSPEPHVIFCESTRLVSEQILHLFEENFRSQQRLYHSKYDDQASVSGLASQAYKLQVGYVQRCCSQSESTNEVERQI